MRPVSNDPSTILSIKCFSKNCFFTWNCDLFTLRHTYILVNDLHLLPEFHFATKTICFQTICTKLGSSGVIIPTRQFQLRRSYAIELVNTSLFWVVSAESTNIIKIISEEQEKRYDCNLYVKQNMSIDMMTNPHNAKKRIEPNIELECYNAGSERQPFK